MSTPQRLQSVMEFEPITPSHAVDFYLAQRETEVADATLYSHRSRLSHFTQWCVKNEVENLNEITGRDLYEFRLWRRTDGSRTPASEKTQMDTLRMFIKWCKSIEAVPTDLHVKVQSPSLSAYDNSRDALLESDDAGQLLAYLEKYEMPRYSTSSSSCCGIR